AVLFFFQAEDGIRDFHVTGVQTCALPIWVPAALSLGENLNLQPVKLPLFINAQLGFMAVYLLAEYDEVVRKLILAHHTALIDRQIGRASCRERVEIAWGRGSWNREGQDAA